MKDPLQEGFNPKSEDNDMQNEDQEDDILIENKNAFSV